MFAGCVSNISKAKKKFQQCPWVLILSRNMPKKWTAVEYGPSSFQNFRLILGKCNTITAELVENETVISQMR